ncbi:MAG: hypothetical protein J7L22_07125 [Candidatus Marinimicrobia bacterium]|nr:hypothetical protein [Candidatus Neomarinimicrobiota bacterium]
MLADKEKNEVVQTILNSKIFRDSPVYQNLLTYLVKSTLAKNIPKEITIAIDVFGKDAEFNLNKDSTVRYHIHMLRSKLENYYKDEGRKDKVRLVIPKGHYVIEFLDHNDRLSEIYRWIISTLIRWEAIVIIILLCTNLFLIFRLVVINRRSVAQHSSYFIDPQDEIWGPFFKNDFPVSIIIGDDFLLDEYCPEFKRYRQIRDWNIDSKNDLYDFKANYPQANLWTSEITNIPFGGVDNLMDLLPIVYQFQKDVSLDMSSKLSLDKIRNHNIIYIGEFKNLRVLDKMIYKLPLRYQYQPDERLFILNELGDTVKSFYRIEAPYEQKDKYNVDYSLLIKIPGFSKENFLFIVGFGYSGRIERTKMLSDSEARKTFIKTIKKTHTDIPEYYIALFEVKSIERTGFTNEMKYFQEIDPEFFDK